jgi:predicted nucleotidyltransferase
MDEATETKIEKYIEILRKQLNIEVIIVFGSYLTDAFSKDSDIDILVVASEFSKMSKLDAYKILSKPIWDVKLNIDPIPAAPEEIKNYKKASFLSEIMNSGKVVFPKSA